MKIAGKEVQESLNQAGTAAAAPSDGDILQYRRKDDVWAPRLGVVVSAVPSASQVLIYNAVTGQWVPTAPGNIPVSVAGVSATTLDAALLEIFSAI